MTSNAADGNVGKSVFFHFSFCIAGKRLSVFGIQNLSNSICNFNIIFTSMWFTLNIFESQVEWLKRGLTSYVPFTYETHLHTYMWGLSVKTLDVIMDIAWDTYKFD